jgi:hypothetical protein
VSTDEAPLLTESLLLPQAAINVQMRQTDRMRAIYLFITIAPFLCDSTLYYNQLPQNSNYNNVTRDYN